MVKTNSIFKLFHICERMETMDKLKKKINSQLTIYFYLTHVKREEIGPLVQFLQKYNIDLRRIKNEKQIRASNFLRQNSNFIAQSSKPISFEEFKAISQFLTMQTIVIGFEYENVIWNVARTKMQFSTHPADVTWNLFNRITF